MSIKNLRYRKCPSCKKHGIDSWAIRGKYYAYPVPCKYCKRVFCADSGMIMIVRPVIIFCSALLGLLVCKVFSIPSAVASIPFLLTWMLFDYFVPLEEKSS